MLFARPAPYTSLSFRMYALVQPSFFMIGGERGALDRVLRNDPEVMPRARRVVLVGLALVGARLVRRQTHGGVRRADLGDRDLVQDRDRDCARARVELADVGNRRVVLSDLARVRRGGLGRPRTGLGGRVVERRVLHRRLAGLSTRLLEGELDALDHGRGLRTRRALERKRRVDVDRRPTALAAAVAAVALLSSSSSPQAVMPRAKAPRRQANSANQRTFKTSLLWRWLQPGRDPKQAGRRYAVRGRALTGRQSPLHPSTRTNSKRPSCSA